MKRGAIGVAGFSHGRGANVVAAQIATKFSLPHGDAEDPSIWPRNSIIHKKAFPLKKI